MKHEDNNYLKKSINIGKIKHRNSAVKRHNNKHPNNELIKQTDFNNLSALSVLIFNNA